MALLLAGCASSSGPHVSGDYAQQRGGRIKYQIQPYQINGVWYYPKADYNYDETGTASWYGDQFNGRPTSDGEIFNMNDVSAAHKTLPLPSVVEVTNLQNGRAIQLRVNDRGPFVDGRIIDLSRRAAQLLGYETAGTTQVRVRILKDESIQVAEAAMHGQTGRTYVAQAPQPAPRPARTEMAAAVVPVQRYEQPVAPAPVQQPALVYQPVQQPAPRPAPVYQPMQQAAAAPLEPRPAPSYRPVQEIASAPVDSEPEPIRPAPRPVQTQTHMAAAAPPPRHDWSLISSAHAETMHPAAAPPPPPMKPTFAVARGYGVVARGAGHIFVQAGAFAVPENAQRVRARIATLGSAEIVSGAGNGGMLYRVRVGPVASQAEAQRLLDKVVGSGYPGARVVGE
ncbi:MAG TPA: septal ring lytic transglycosylase RlpA family protein [Stellaceae bacterium]|nr:septal ring lytic transglycosylase RlpA family protein [Stellaceae bacterium]